VSSRWACSGRGRGGVRGGAGRGGGGCTGGWGASGCRGGSRGSGGRRASGRGAGRRSRCRRSEAAGVRAGLDGYDGAVLVDTSAVDDLNGNWLRSNVDIPRQGGGGLLGKSLECCSRVLSAGNDAGEVRWDTSGPSELSGLAFDEGWRRVDGEVLSKGGGGESEGDGEELHGEIRNVRIVRR